MKNLLENKETFSSMRSLILIIIPYIILDKTLIKNLFKKPCRSMRSLILVGIPHIILYKTLIQNLLKTTKTV